MDLLHMELNQIAMEWNTHRIRPTRQNHSPPGIPDELCNIQVTIHVQIFIITN